MVCAEPRQARGRPEALVRELDAAAGAEGGRHEGAVDRRELLGVGVLDGGHAHDGREARRERVAPTPSPGFMDATMCTRSMPRNSRFSS